MAAHIILSWCCAEHILPIPRSFLVLRRTYPGSLLSIPNTINTYHFHIAYPVIYNMLFITG